MKIGDLVRIYPNEPSDYSDEFGVIIGYHKVCPDDVRPVVGWGCGHICVYQKYKLEKLG